MFFLTTCIPLCSEYQLWAPSEDAPEDTHIYLWYLLGHVGPTSWGLRQLRHPFSFRRNKWFVVFKKYVNFNLLNIFQFISNFEN